MSVAFNTVSLCTTYRIPLQGILFCTLEDGFTQEEWKEFQNPKLEGNDEKVKENFVDYSYKKQLKLSNEDQQELISKDDPILNDNEQVDKVAGEEDLKEGGEKIQSQDQSNNESTIYLDPLSHNDSVEVDEKDVKKANGKQLNMNINDEEILIYADGKKDNKNIDDEEDQEKGDDEEDIENPYVEKGKERANHEDKKKITDDEEENASDKEDRKNADDVGDKEDVDNENKQKTDSEEEKKEC